MQQQFEDMLATKILNEGIYSEKQIEFALDGIIGNQSGEIDQVELERLVRNDLTTLSWIN